MQSVYLTEFRGTIFSCSVIDPLKHLITSLISVVAFVEFILDLTEGRTLANVFCLFELLVCFGVVIAGKRNSCQ
jgi:hypothetical protein